MSRQIFEHYIGLFHAKGESVLIAICSCAVPSRIVLEQYKKLPPIETMPKHEKREMWKFVTELFPKKTKEERFDCAKIIYTIGNSL